MTAGEGAKSKILTELWTRVKFEQAPFDFDTEVINQACLGRYKNPHTLTKLDRLEEVPPAMINDDVFIAHLGGGNHRFVKGLRFGFHDFEPFEGKPEERLYTRTYLDELGGGEAGMLSRVYNHGLIQLFLYGDDTIRPRIRLPGRTSNARDNTFDYTIGDQSIHVSQLQVEMDFIVEHVNETAFAEAKSGLLKPNFAVAQIFMPYLKLLKLRERLKATYKVRPLFIFQYWKQYSSQGVPRKSYEHIRFYEYQFSRPQAMDSLEIARKGDIPRIQEYVLIPR